MRRVGVLPASRAARSWGTALVLIAGTTVAGCDYLYGSGLDPDEFQAPEVVARYVDGSATVTLGEDAPLELRELSAAALYADWWGGEATWTNGAGWYLRVVGASTASGFLGGAASVNLDLVSDGRHWTTYDSSRCIVTIEQADERALRGTASCKGLRWSDAIAGFGGGFEPSYVAGEDPFDAEIVFEALPSSGTPA